MEPSLAEQLANLAEQARLHRDDLVTEEATKNALVMPFLHAVLGYNVFNPLEVVPEFTADVGERRGEKVDYAIKHDGQVQILIEAKKIAAELDKAHAEQLWRYFAATNARIAILTNGQVWKFYTDLEKANLMDEQPFMVIDLLDIDRQTVPELAKLTKANFDLDSVIGTAEELKYVSQIKRELARQFAEPNDEWVKFIATKVYDKAFTKMRQEQFRPIVAKALHQWLNDQITARLKSTLDDVERPAAPAPETPEDDGPEAPEDGIVTTVEELQGFEMVRAIACAVVPAKRIAHRDSKSYFSILLDDSNRKPIARLHFNTRRKQISIFDDTGKETKHPLEGLEHIYDYADAIRARVTALA